MKKSQHPCIRYSQSWEDADILLRALLIRPDDQVLSITSGGCNALALLAESPAQLIVVDNNPVQNYLFELKLKAIEHFGTSELLQFLGLEVSVDRYETYKQFRDQLSEDARSYWNTHPEILQKGILHAGRFENYLRLFRSYFLPLIHSKKTIRKLLAEKSIAEQKEFYRTIWDNRRWRFFFAIFFSETLMRMLGRSPDMFRYSQAKKISQHYLEKVQTAFTRSSVFRNSYVNYILLGNYSDDPPWYLRDEKLAAIRKVRTTVKIHSKKLITLLEELSDRSIHKFNLSDVFEPASEEETAHTFREIVRVGAPGARIVFWNNLVKRDVPEELRPRFREESELEVQLKDQEKVFFYNELKIYTLVG